jgi:hypothetical protein
MSAPEEHAILSSRRFGGIPEDYINIHELMDSTRSAHGDERHRLATHNSWFVTTILPKIFGHSISNSEGFQVLVYDIGRFHVMEDYRGYFPTLSDFATVLKLEQWMKGEGEGPPSSSGIEREDLEELYNPTRSQEYDGDLIRSREIVFD